jgi:cyclic beta-1,2-glucan synthetase
MPVNIPSLLRRALGRSARRSLWHNDEILRAELFSIERLEEHAASLAAAQPITQRRGSRHSLSVRLGQNESVLLASYRSIAAAAAEGRPITPAAEWLLDNYHVIEEQIREIREDLPPKFYRLLPKLASGPFSGYPRVFGIAWAFVAHTDSRFDPESLRRFVRAYQRVQPLTIGELWAVAITLRVVLIENLRRAASRIVSSRAQRQQADAAADRLLGVNGLLEPQSLRGRDAEQHILAPAFVVQLVQRLRDQDPRVTPALQWLEERLIAQGTTSNQLVREEHQRQGASNVTVRNIITSMRLLSDVDWPEFFESVSLVDELLRAGSDFAAMDFPTRNLYRHAIERLARGSKLTEMEIAEAALAAAARAAGGDATPRERDPGYHLFAEGERAFEAQVGFRSPLWIWPNRVKFAHGAVDYIAVIAVLAACVLSMPLLVLHEWGVARSSLMLLALLGLVPALDAAIALINRAVMRSFGATILPGLALRDGVPPPLRTLVVVPALLTSSSAIEQQIERLEIHYLASPEGELHFALLSDWTDASSQRVAGDQMLLDAAIDGIAQLNRRYGPAAAGDRFLLLHRRRVWSQGQRQWMGWERKRGKLHELNRLLRGATDTSFLELAGQPAWVPPEVRYVITLDADTRLPRETARRLVGKMAHPLNRPRFDAVTGHVLEGYAVLQPRIAASLPIGREGSLFQRVFSSASGIDPYAAAVSDVYQDVFGEGSYAGKGIYEIDTFEAALAGRVPEGTLLSHDLFEGIFARAGLVSDVEVVEEFPSRYDVAASRQHRWARGDWQLLPWIFGRGGRGLPLISQWKMLDNLRRSLTAPSSLAAAVAGWLLPQTRAAVLWTAFVAATLALPALLPVFGAIIPHRAGIKLRSHLRALRKDVALAACQFLLLLTFTAHQAWSMLDAIARTLFRLFLSRRNLLQWVTAAQSNLSPQLRLGSAYGRMSGGLLLAAAAAGLVGALQPQAWRVAAPLVLLWLASPAIAVWISISPRVAGRLAVSETDASALRLVARRTWRFFEAFVTPADHMLPPDNFQEDPRPVLAHRTSPTNMGLYLLSAVSARDFGWAGTSETVERLEATVATMGRLDRFRGHFYNWYDTQDLRALEPRYVSSVDSGNLAAHLIALSNACREWIDVCQAPHESLAGIADAMTLTREALGELTEQTRSHTIACQQLEHALDAVAALSQRSSASMTFDLRLAQLTAAAATLVDIAQALASELGEAAGAEVLFWAQATQRSIASARRDTALSDQERQSLSARLAALESTAHAMAEAMQFGFLLDPERRLLSIGYRAADATLDPSCYDLLASEARLASFVAIAKNDVPARHWFRLGRPVTPIGYGAALVSWSGSMFEYLMPSLVMRAPAGSLLEQTNRLIVQRQIRYGAQLGVPWGISESAYNARDLESTYQYSNFGVPGLGIKRGLAENTVIAPYATALAAMVDPQRAAQNFVRLAALEARGRYGFREALDYTRSRVPEGARFALVQAFMAHHQGMTVVAIANVLLDGRMRERFHAEPSIRATELLLQERTPRDVSIVNPRPETLNTAARMHDAQLAEVRRLFTPHDLQPQTHLLSNGRYAVMLTSAGSGYSRWRDLGVTRWREDPTRDDSGSYLFLRDVDSGAVWSAGYQPSGIEPDSYAVTFTEDRAEFVRTDGAITSTLEIVVSPEDDAEVRRLSIANNSGQRCDIEVTSYSELVLAPPAADTAHPAFSKMFVQTEYLTKTAVLLATRRRRSAEEPDIWVAHHAVVEGESIGKPEVETDRARFIGRGRDIQSPIAVMDGRHLSNTTGTVLDPVFALRYRLRIAAGTTARIAFWTDVTDSRESALAQVDKHRETNGFARAATLAWTQAQIQLRHLGVDAAEANMFQRLAGHVLFADASMRPASDTIRRGGGTPAALWAQGISGDLPIVLLRIDSIDDIAIARALLRAHEYWRMKQLAVDLVILNERAPSYLNELQTALETQLRMSQSRPRLGADHARGAVFVLRTDLIPEQTRALLSSVARVVLAGQRGSLADQLERLRGALLPDANLRPARPAVPANIAVVAPASLGLEFFNGLGGFADEGREYVTLLGPGQSTPAPWINVIANARFGFQVATEGSGFTWSLNSRDHQLTPWSNDPVSDRPGEIMYVRDEDSGELWGPTALPIRDHAGCYSARHGQGYSRFEHSAHGIELDLLMYVPMDDPIKISRLRLRNSSGRSRRLSVTAYVEWVLGSTRAATAPFLVTDLDPVTGAMFARNPWSAEFGSRIAFADLAGRQTQWSADRREFLGRFGTLEAPAALRARAALSRRVGAGLDPCAALQTSFELEPDQTTEVVFLLGEAATAAEAQSLLLRYRAADLDTVFRAVVGYWDDALGKVQVKTPSRCLDIILNRWMLYQTLACRMWARSAFYQASGAYGFRDQLQDGMALALARPALAREHLLRAASCQFIEGDVQHWWLPSQGSRSSGPGVRTRISDDRVWLAYATAHYLETTADSGILDEQVPFIEGQLLGAAESEAFFQPAISDQSAALFEHCARALDQSLQNGAHGLPLMGTGDWNDGMNRVGVLGKGESVWLGWFLYATLAAFAPLARARGERARASQWLAHAAALRESLEREAWDGNWYRRGYFDDGTALGSAASSECRIDSIAQSWSVISHAADPARSVQAMVALDTHLIQRDTGLALLFTPPFDQTPLDPGYIKGYPPGIRENGGQYTHAATWSVIAHAMLGHGNRAAELFTLLNPITRSSTRADVQRYKVEPYVVAADIYSVAPHAGRGGWTWYSGSAGWMYRTGLEWILGFRVQGASLLLTPCVPENWPGFEITFKYRTARYHIRVANPHGVSRGIAHAELDGKALPVGQARIALADDGADHSVRVTLGGTWVASASSA